MANKTLFKGHRGRAVPKTDAVNAAGGKAYALSAKSALARYAATGCLSSTYYVKAEDHLDRIIDLAAKCDEKFVAQLAIFARKEGFMKDMPALLMAHLSTRGNKGAKYLKAAFPVVIDNGTMLRTFLQIITSGRLGRKSLGTGPRNLCQKWLTEHDAEWVFRQLSVQHGGFTAKDVVSVVHPNGAEASKEHDALFGYWTGKVVYRGSNHRYQHLPKLVKDFEKWKRDRTQLPPKVDFRLLTAQQLDAKQWATIIQQGNYHFVRMNLNTAVRQGAFKADPGLEEHVAQLLTDENVIRKVRLMPYQILAAYKSIDAEVPRCIVDALHDAMEKAVLNAPMFDGKLLVIIDVSGSMRSPVTGYQYGGIPASKVSCVEVAALFSAAMLRKNKVGTVLPVDTSVHSNYRPEPRNTVLTEAQKLAQFGGGGTALSEGLRFVNSNRKRYDHVVVLSDQESWADRSYVGWGFGRPPGTTMMHEWEEFRSRNPGAKMVCIDIQPGTTHQTIEGRDDILHVSGWNDSVFRVTEAFLKGDQGSWLDIIDAVPLFFEPVKL